MANCKDIKPKTCGKSGLYIPSDTCNNATACYAKVCEAKVTCS